MYFCVRSECLPGLEIADAGQRQQRLHHQAARGRVLLRRLVRTPPFDEQAGRGHRRERRAEAHRREERRQERAARRQHRVGRRPTAPRRMATVASSPHRRPNRRKNSAASAPSPITSCVSSATRCSGRDRKSPCSRLSAAVACDLDAGEQRVERRGDDLARAQRRRADEHDLVGERPRIGAAGEHVSRRSRYGNERFGAAIAQQQVALAVERDRAIAAAGARGNEQRGLVHVGDPDRGRPCCRWPSTPQRARARDRRCRRTRRASARAGGCRPDRERH